MECVPPWRVLGSATATQQEAAGASRRRGRQGGGGPLAARRAEGATPLTAGRRAAKMQGIGVLHGSEGCQRCAGSYPGGAARVAVLGVVAVAAAMFAMVVIGLRAFLVLMRQERVRSARPDRKGSGRRA